MIFGLRVFNLIVMRICIEKVAFLLGLFLMFAACTEDVYEDDKASGWDSLNNICIKGADFQYEQNSRSSVSISESGASFSWGQNDTVGVFPNKGDQVSFAMEQGAGMQTATFSGGGWALKSSSTYSAYYPYNFYNRDIHKIPVSYLGQVQSGNANTEHIGAYDFMAASIVSPENGAVAFDMQHLGCLVQMKIDLNEIDNIQKLTLRCGDEDEQVFITNGYVDITSTTPKIESLNANYANTIDIELKDFNVAQDEEAIVYFMMAPVDLENKELEVLITNANGNLRTFQIEGKEFVAGKAYSMYLSEANEVDDFSWFNPYQYITYVDNYELLFETGNSDYLYHCRSRIECPISSYDETIGAIEFKFCMNSYPESTATGDDNIYLCCENKYYDSHDAVFMNDAGVTFRYAGDDVTYSWQELNESLTNLMTLNISFKNNALKINDTNLNYLMPSGYDFNADYFFTDYYREYDEGLYKDWSGVPVGSKLYYIKVWDKNDKLIYLGGATISVNPDTNNEEYCWRSWYNGSAKYEFAHYPKDASNYIPYGGGVGN